MAKDHGSSIKDDEQYEALREEGASKEKAARIANTDRSTAGKRGGESSSYEDWSKDTSRSREGDRHRGALEHEQGRADRRASQPLRARRSAAGSSVTA